MLRTVYLHGPLKEKFGASHEFDIEDALDAFRALRANFAGFDQDLIQGKFRIVRGGLDDGMELGEEDLTLGLGQARELHIVPVTEGAGRGAGKIVLGVAIMGIALAGGYMAGMGFVGPLAEGATVLGTGMAESAFLGITWGNIAMFGAAMALTGIASLLSPMPEMPKPRDRNESFLFQGPMNTSEQGPPVPLVYGRMRVGSVLVSAEIVAEEV